jgi:hypothetical protein
MVSENQCLLVLLFLGDLNLGFVCPQDLDFGYFGFSFKFSRM